MKSDPSHIPPAAASHGVEVNASRTRGALAAAAAWAAAVKGSFWEGCSSDRKDQIEAAVKAAAVSSAIVAGAVTFAFNMDLGTEHDANSIQGSIVSTLQENHGAYALGLSQGFGFDGVEISQETLQIIERIAPPPGGADAARNALLRKLQDAGIIAAMSGEFDPGDLHDYAEFIDTMPDHLEEVSYHIDTSLGRDAQEDPTPKIVNAVVTVSVEIPEGKLNNEAWGLRREWRTGKSGFDLEADQESLDRSPPYGTSFSF